MTSASNCTDFQSQRLRITYHRVHQGRAGKKLANTGKKYAHTVSQCVCSLALVRDLRLQLLPALNVLSVQVNGTACALPRIIVSLLENYQQEVQ